MGIFVFVNNPENSLSHVPTGLGKRFGALANLPIVQQYLSLNRPSIWSVSLTFVVLVVFRLWRLMPCCFVAATLPVVSSHMILHV
jgi:hypothetical protein